MLCRDPNLIWTRENASGTVQHQTRISGPPQDQIYLWWKTNGTAEVYTLLWENCPVWTYRVLLRSDLFLDAQLLQTKAKLSFFVTQYIPDVLTIPYFSWSQSVLEVLQIAQTSIYWLNEVSSSGLSTVHSTFRNKYWSRMMYHIANLCYCRPILFRWGHVTS